MASIINNNNNNNNNNNKNDDESKGEDITNNDAEVVVSDPTIVQKMSEINTTLFLNNQKKHVNSLILIKFFQELRFLALISCSNLYLFTFLKF